MRLALIRGACAWEPARSVSCHNDPLPRNVLFDGERLWLIDWASACRNDPLVDIAVMLDNFAGSQELEHVLLEAWLGRVPDESLYRRLALIRALTRIYYAGVMLSASTAAFGAGADRDLSVPSLDAMERAIHDGRQIPGAPETKHVLGKMFLAAFLYGTATPRLD